MSHELRNYEPVYQPEELEILKTIRPRSLSECGLDGFIVEKGSWQHRVNLNLSGGGSTARYYASISTLMKKACTTLIKR